jgi:radical SAM enzyme (TIGR01210 family)
VVKALVVVLRTHGCSWARSTNPTGGCTMCGYLNDCVSTNIPIQPEDIVYQFRSVVDKFKNTQFNIVKIFTSGSFLDDAEVPPEVQENILKICNNSGVENVIFESRPEFVTSEKLEELSTFFPGRIQVAIGLETTNDIVRNHAINKGFQFEDYCNAIQIIKDLDILVKTYLLLKPPFLTEQDSITDVLQSIRELRDKELTDCISINPVNIQKFTVIEYLLNRGDYRPPWLWSVIEVLERGYELLKDTRIRLISQPTAGGSRRGPHNCGNCDKTALQAIKEFSLDNNPGVFHDLACTCREKWKDLLGLENIVKSTLELKPEPVK